MNDERLVQEFKNGNIDAFEELLNRYQPKVLNTCFRYLNDIEEARDATQDIFIKVYHALPRFKPRAKVSTWLYRIAVNHALNVQRSKKKGRFLQKVNSLSREDMKQIQQFPTEVEDNGDAAVQTQERLQLVQSALQKLGDAQRTAVILHRFEGLSYKEIAQVMSTSVSAVESLLFRAKQNLHKLLKPYFGQHEY